MESRSAETRRPECWLFADTATSPSRLLTAARRLQASSLLGVAGRSDSAAVGGQGGVTRLRQTAAGWVLVILQVSSAVMGTIVGLGQAGAPPDWNSRASCWFREGPTQECGLRSLAFWAPNSWSVRSPRWYRSARRPRSAMRASRSPSSATVGRAAEIAKNAECRRAEDQVRIERAVSPARASGNSRAVF